MKAIVHSVAGGAVLAVVMFAAAGTIRWWHGWVVVGAFVLISFLTGRLFARNPALAAERKAAHQNASKADRILVTLTGLLMPAMIVVGALDYRFGWSRPIGDAPSLVATLIMFAGVALTYAAMMANAFFSSHIRIQTDRGQTVISNGPYAYVRHPGYAGAILFNSALPVVLGSFVATVLSPVFLVLTVVRTAMEDRILREGLTGYKDYAAKVKYRLVPFIW